MIMLNNGQPVPLHEIPRGAFVLVQDGRWRQLESWRVLDKVEDRPDAPRYMVFWAGTELYPSTYHKEPSWPVRVKDGGPEAAETTGTVR